MTMEEKIEDILRRRGAIHVINGHRMYTEESVKCAIKEAQQQVKSVDLSILDNINGVEIITTHGRSYVAWDFVNKKEIILKNNNRTLRVTAQEHSES